MTTSPDALQQRGDAALNAAREALRSLYGDTEALAGSAHEAALQAALASLEQSLTWWAARDIVLRARLAAWEAEEGTRRTRITYEAVARNDAPFAHLFPDRLVPLRSRQRIRPRNSSAEPCYLVAGDMLTEEQIRGLAVDLYAEWQGRLASVEAAASYIRQDLPLQCSWFDAVVINFGVAVRGQDAA